MNQGRNIAADYRFHYADGRVSVVCESTGITPPSSRLIKGIKARAAEIIAEHVVSDKEPMLLRKILHKSYALYKHEDIPKMVQTAHAILNGLSDFEVYMKGRERRMAELYSSFYDYLQTSASVDIDGWICFRMPGYRSELNDAVDLAVDEYLMDQQYEEFIGLLKCYVQLQDTRVPLIHLQHIKGTDFRLLDEQMHPLGTIPAYEGITIKMADQELQMEDAVVSSLISLSPAKIMIHTHEPEMRMIGTIQEIFGDRAQLCSD